MPKSKLKETHLVTKQNALNEMRTHNMTLQELRLFSVYLSKINPLDVNTRVVRFPIADFQAIMELSQSNIAYFQGVAESLLNKPIKIPTERGGFEMFHIFQVFIIDPDDDGRWYVEIDANDRALPLLFDFKGHYFKYELWNALRLRSRNQLRMYEILKQYEKIGHRILSVSELKELLGVDEHEYPEYKIFKRDVIAVCQSALAKHTDISFTYEPHGKKGRGGKVMELKFSITKNKDFKDPLSLKRFITLGSDAFDSGDDYMEEEVSSRYQHRMELFSEMCEGDFSVKELGFINELLHRYMPHIFMDDIKCADFISLKYQEMLINDERNGNIKHKFKYLCKLIELG